MQRALYTTLLVTVLPVLVFRQSTSGKYQPGTLLAIKPHGSATSSGSPPTAYDISIEVNKTAYTVLYIPSPGTYGDEYSVRYELLVSVGSKTITYNDMLGRSREVRILKRQPANNNGQ